MNGYYFRWMSDMWFFYMMARRRGGTIVLCPTFDEYVDFMEWVKG